MSKKGVHTQFTKGKNLFIMHDGEHFVDKYVGKKERDKIVIKDIRGIAIKR